MPDRIAEAAGKLQAIAADLHDEMWKLRRWLRWLIIAVVVSAVALVGTAGLAVYNWRARVDENHSRCVATNQSHTAIREADTARGDSLVALVESFDLTSPEGRRFLARLKAQNETVEADLAHKLPVVDC